MSDDAKVPCLSDDQIRQVAGRIKKRYGLQNTRPINIIRFLESGRVLTVTGWKQLKYIVCSDDEMSDSDGRTEFSENIVTIFVRRSVHDRAKFGDGRARMTLAHELAHSVLHSSVPLHRRVGASGATVLSRVKPSESAEHQAKVFASAFLIHDDVAAELGSAERISEDFVVSLEAAQICFERLRSKIERQESGRRIDQAAKDFRRQVTGGEKGNQRTFAIDPCPACAERRLIPIGAKFLCDNCGNISEQV